MRKIKNTHSMQSTYTIPIYLLQTALPRAGLSLSLNELPDTEAVAHARISTPNQLSLTEYSFESNFGLLQFFCNPVINTSRH